MFHSINDILKSNDFQNKLPREIKRVVRKVSRDKKRRELQQKPKEDQQKSVA